MVCYLWQFVTVCHRALQEAQEIFGIDFDFEEFEQFDEDEEEEEEEDEEVSDWLGSLSVNHFCSR